MGAKGVSNWRLFCIYAALLLMFFPCALLYSYPYPGRELAALVAWTFAFPSSIGLAVLCLFPVLPNETYGYSAFNLLCVVATMASGIGAFRLLDANPELWHRLYRFVMCCMVVSLLLAFWQGFDGERWMEAFPMMWALGGGRGGGLRTEPSLLACPLAVYLSMALFRCKEKDFRGKEVKHPIREVIVIALATLVLTRSLTVAIVLFCFLPVFTTKLRYLFASGAVGALLGAAVFWDRIRDALPEGGTFTYLITTDVKSWRNIPDILILANVRDYLLPSNPAGIRDKLNFLATMWNPGLAWLINTYSTFSASATTIGVIVTAIVFGAGLLVGARKIPHASHMRATWFLLYIADWFILPKYEVSGWVALGLLTAIASKVYQTETNPTPEAASSADRKFSSDNAGCGVPECS